MSASSTCALILDKIYILYVCLAIPRLVSSVSRALSTRCCHGNCQTFNYCGWSFNPTLRPLLLQLILQSFSCRCHGSRSSNSLGEMEKLKCLLEWCSNHLDDHLNTTIGTVQLNTDLHLLLSDTYRGLHCLSVFLCPSVFLTIMQSVLETFDPYD